MPSWVPDWRKPMIAPRTILSVMGGVDEKSERDMQSKVKHNCGRTEDNSRLDCTGTVIGSIKRVSCPIYVHAEFEKMMMDVREEFEDSPERMNEEILKLWELYPWKEYESLSELQLSEIEQQIWLLHFESTSDMLLSHDESVAFLQGSLVPNDSSQDAALGRPKYSLDLIENSIQDHLIKRSRQTAFWSEEAVLDGNIVIDKTSIIDGRSFGLWRHLQHGKCTAATRYFSKLQIALLPSTTKSEDLIITLEGGRVPYVIRPAPLATFVISDNNTHSQIQIPEVGLECEFVGECLINDFEELQNLGDSTTKLSFVASRGLEELRRIQANLRDAFNSWVQKANLAP
jgi:hypothetical protein